MPIDLLTVLQGDALEQLRTLPDASVHMCATSPPYWGLRDYGTATWEGGVPGCDHRHPAEQRQLPHGDGRKRDSYADERVLKPGVGALFRHTCGRCGAVRMDQQIGLEETPDCGLRGKFRIRRDLTADQRERVARWLLDGAGCDGARGGNDGKA